MKYTFATDQFGVNEAGVHLLRSRYCYKTIPYATVDNITITKGKPIKNWLILLAFGTACLLFSVYYALVIIDFFETGSGRIYIEEIVVPVIPALMGGFAILAALKTAPIAVVRHGGSKLVFDLTPLAKQSELTLFIDYLKTEVGYRKLTVDPIYATNQEQQLSHA
jgi:hypothetical protein